MFAIVDLAGKQYRVEEGKKVYVHRLAGDEGSTVTFDKVLMIDMNGKVNIGQPTIEGASVQATILAHLKGDKVLVFKKKRRKGYQKLNGHRQYLSQIKIDTIAEKSVAKRAPKVEAKPETAEPVADSAE
jgi:large subunit ribosomal protein L21